MPPAVLVEFRFDTTREARRFAVGGGITVGAGCAGGSATARMRAVPGAIWMVFADPAAILAAKTVHRQFLVRCRVVQCD